MALQAHCHLIVTFTVITVMHGCEASWDLSLIVVNRPELTTLPPHCHHIVTFTVITVVTVIYGEEITSAGNALSNVVWHGTKGNLVAIVVSEGGGIRRLIPPLRAMCISIR